MKAVKFELAGRERYLAFTVEAMFQIEEQFGPAGKLLDAINVAGRDGLSAICKAAAILAEQGELARRGMGYEPEPMPDAEAIAATLDPVSAAKLKLAIPAAMSLGYGREIEPEKDEIDLGLAELNAQKKHTEARPLYPHGGGRGAIQERNTVIYPRRGGGPVGAVPSGPWGEAGGR